MFKLWIFSSIYKISCRTFGQRRLSYLLLSPSDLKGKMYIRGQMSDFFNFLIIGFLAQLVDGALGMAYGIISTTLLLSIGFSPASASATTHASECLTTGFSALAHHQFGNVNRQLFLRLLMPGIIGSVIGVILLTHVDSASIKPFIAIYLMVLGFIIIGKIFREIPPKTVTHHLMPLGFIGALLDAIGGGGWGPIVTSSLLARGNDVRTTIGSVNACEFFITMTVSATFLVSGTYIGWHVVTGLAIGGAIASPISALLCKYVPIKYLFFAVGSLIVILSAHTLWLSFSSFD